MLADLKKKKKKICLTSERSFPRGEEIKGSAEGTSLTCVSGRRRQRRQPARLEVAQGGYRSPAPGTQPQALLQPMPSCCPVPCHCH